MTHTLVAIKSVHFGFFISLDARQVTADSPYGTGKVTGAKHAQSWEIFKLHRNADGTVSFESSEWAGVYLSLDGRGVVPGVRTDPGGGQATGIKHLQAWEKFTIVRKPTTGHEEYEAIVGIESDAFKGRFLKASPDIVNVQGVMSDWEEFYIAVVG